MSQPLVQRAPRSRDQFESVHFIKFLDDVAAKEISSTSGREAPSRNLLGIAPHQIAHRAVVRHLLLPVDGPYLVHCGDRRGQPAVHTQDAVIDERGEGEVIEDVGAVAPVTQNTTSV